MWTVLVRLVEFVGVLAKAFLALFAGEDHFGLFGERMLFGFGVAFGAVKPSLAAWGADGDLGV